MSRDTFFGIVFFLFTVVLVYAAIMKHEDEPHKEPQPQRVLHQSREPLPGINYALPI